MPAAAALPGAAPSAGATLTSAPAIEAEAAAGSDERIASRIRGIFSELPRLVEIEVEVEQGVVTLSGTVADLDDKARAEAIAARVSGVVTVENRIERSVSVAGDLGGLEGLRGRVDRFVAMLPLIALATAVALAIGALGHALASLTRLWRRAASNAFLAELVASAVRFVFILGGIVVALDMLGAGALMGAVLGGAGLVGIALGFAMRDTIENYLASLMLSLRQPFRPNDLVVIAGHEGRVLRLTSRATILMTLDGNHLRIPNSEVFKAVILNYSRNPQRRFDFVLGIDAADDPTAARRAGVEVLRGLDFVLGHPEPQAWIQEVGDSNIVIRYLAWIDQRETDFNKGRSRAIHAVKDALEEAGFALPEPIYRLRFDAGTPPVEAPAVAAPARRSARRVALAGELDTSPDNEVAEMVENERAETPAEADLLDSNRPVE